MLKHVMLIPSNTGIIHTYCNYLHVFDLCSFIVEHYSGLPERWIFLICRLATRGQTLRSPPNVSCVPVFAVACLSILAQPLIILIIPSKDSKKSLWSSTRTGSRAVYHSAKTTLVNRATKSSQCHKRETQCQLLATFQFVDTIVAYSTWEWVVELICTRD